MKYECKQYWEERLSKHFNLEGVGYLGRGELFNKFLYKSKVRTMERALQRSNLEVLEITLLDIGSGTGFWVDYFLAKGAAKIVGVDITSTSIRSLTEKHASDLSRCEFLQADVSNTNFKNYFSDSYDLVTAIDILYHIPDDAKFSQAIKNIGGCLKSQGYFIATGILYKNKKAVDIADYIRARGVDFWQSELNKCGLKVQSLIPMYFFLHPAFNAVGLTKKLVNTIHYGITPIAVKIPLLDYLYFLLLYNLDSLMTLIPLLRAPSMKLLVARKI